MRGRREVEVNNLNLITAGVLGNKGTGKTCAVLVLAHHIAQEKPTVLIDAGGVSHHHPELKRFSEIDVVSVDVYPEGESSRKKILRILHNSIKDGKILLIADELRCEDRERFYNDFGEYLWDRGDVALLIDEAHEVFPLKKKVISPDFERIMRIGRNKGIFPVIIASQRPQFISKRALALCDAYFVFRLDYYRDADLIAENIGFESYNAYKKFRRMLKKREIGECYFIQNNSVRRFKFDLENKKIWDIQVGRPFIPE